DELRSRLRANVDLLSPGHPSPIVSVVLGDEARAVEASRRLLDQGLFVPAIRPPTVPAHSARLRISLSAAHQTNQVEQIVTALAALGRDHDPDAGGRGQT
ncbi:MAG TPA: aminotransferase class I/II-fold pyridoxal phosphate-dependent enzyme, partial [Acidimicrobiales bacterium]|nr:aminotransferase class I/II-fold pyridoxal phosphate-dependent enzyme [Acidimicrobiales bacterium]